MRPQQIAGGKGCPFNIVLVPASQCFIDPFDIATGKQRDPLDRLPWLAGRFGDDGEKFNHEKFGVLVGKMRTEGEHKGKYALKEGGGRWYAVTHLLKKPDMLIPVAIVTGDDLDIFEGQNDRVRVPPGLLYWGRGSDPGNKYEYKLCQLLASILPGFTTIPGKPGSVGVNHAQFLGDLGVLRKTLTVAHNTWGTARNGKRIHIEGIGLAGLGGFFAIYPDHDPSRLSDTLAATGRDPQSRYANLKEDSKLFLPTNKEHARQWGLALCKQILTLYNSNQRKINRLSIDLIPSLEQRIRDTAKLRAKFNIFSGLWEMRAGKPSADMDEGDDAESNIVPLADVTRRRA